MTWRLHCQINVTSKRVTWSQYQAKKTVINKVQIVDQTWRFFFRGLGKGHLRGVELDNTNPYICIKFDSPPKLGRSHLMAYQSEKKTNGIKTHGPGPQHLSLDLHTTLCFLHFTLKQSWYLLLLAMVERCGHLGKPLWQPENHDSMTCLWWPKGLIFQFGDPSSL